ncbi:MAG TPA: hypothetical protein VNE16_05385 [Vicinamibacterales bacterium]|nr:hypothetical protein [Vicinamibacterales bacterium]
MSDAPHQAAYHDPDVAHEDADISFNGAVAFGVSLIVTCVLCGVVVAVLFRVFAGTTLRQAPGLGAVNVDVAPMEKIESPTQMQTYPLQPAASTPIGPGVQANPPADLAALLARENAILDTYGWVDQSNGVVRIPIARAMQLLVQRGLPSRKNPPPIESPLYPEVSSSGRMMEQLVP